MATSAKMGLVDSKATTKKQQKAGVAFPRYFTHKLEPGKTPYDEVQWETRTASIGNDKGTVIFEQRDMANDPNGREANFGAIRSDGSQKGVFTTTIRNLLNTYRG